MSAPSRLIVAIDPARLAWGEWCHRTEKQLGEGDIRASYSGDCIATSQAVRKPFRWQGNLWVSVGSRPNAQHRLECEAYRLIHPAAFSGTPTTYRDKCRDADAARADPNGFYHGMRVRHGGAEMVMAGPAVAFVPGEVEQLSLF